MSANVPRDVRLGLRLAVIGQRWLDNGAGDGNRKYRPGAGNRFISTSYELDQALRVIFV